MGSGYENGSRASPAKSVHSFETGAKHDGLTVGVVRERAVSKQAGDHEVP
jgi:hypothetical protein